jgi:hypothetical protein
MSPTPLVIDTLPNVQDSQQLTDATILYKSNELGTIGHRAYFQAKKDLGLLTTAGQQVKGLDISRGRRMPRAR